MRTISLPKLRAVLDKHFSLEELNTLAFDLGLDFDNLAGATKVAKARELVSYLDHRGRLEELVAAVGRARSHLSLADLIYEEAPTPKTSVEAEEIAAEYGREIEAIRRRLERHRLVPFLGADLDQSITSVPSRRIIADSLARQEGLETGQRLSAVALQAANYGNRFGFTDHLRRLLMDAKPTPQPLHRHLVALVQENQLETLITTAYDDVLETAFGRAGVPLNVVVGDNELRFIDVDTPTLIKLYGDWRQPASLVVTDQDESALLLGRAQGKQEIVEEIKQAFRRSTLLFIGYDLGDTAVSVLFDSVAGDQFQLPAYALWSGLSPRQAEAWRSNRGLTVIDAHPVVFLKLLLEK